MFIRSFKITLSLYLEDSWNVFQSHGIICTSLSAWCSFILLLRSLPHRALSPPGPTTQSAPQHTVGTTAMSAAQVQSDKSSPNSRPFSLLYVPYSPMKVRSLGVCPCRGVWTPAPLSCCSLLSHQLSHGMDRYRMYPMKIPTIMFFTMLLKITGFVIHSHI